MLPDSSAVLNGLVAKLGADAALLAHVPHGVYEDMAPPHATRFVIVSHVIVSDQAVLHQGRVIEHGLYLVEARVLAGAGAANDAALAAARIDALLDDGTLELAGYRLTDMHREEFVRGTEIDAVDPAIVWKRRGGRYRVTVYHEMVASAIAAESLYDTRVDRFGLIAIALWFDGPLKVPDGTDITVEVISSDPARHANAVLFMSPPLSAYTVTDPAAPGRAFLHFRAAFDMSDLAGLSFTLNATSPRGNWSKLLNRETGAPVADSLDGVVLVIGPLV